MLSCQAAHLAQLQTEPFSSWLQRMQRPAIAHRKFWEFAYIAQALFERDLLRPGRRGLGFAVGTEPLPGLFATLGCDIIATDQPQHSAGDWAAAGMHAHDKTRLTRGIDQVAAARISFQPVDMNAVPDSLTGFDFLWSSCAIEHVGSIAHCLAFVGRAMRCLKPGGVAVHTTELNLSSDERTLDRASTVLLRRQDLQLLKTLLSVHRHVLAPLSFEQDDYPVDTPPFENRIEEASYHTLPHMRLAITDYVSTSYGLIVKAA